MKQQGLKKEYGKSHHYWPLCLTFTGRLIIHYSWLSVCWSQASYCCLNQISISTIQELRFWTTPKLWPLSLPALRTSPCVFSDYARYLFSQMRPADQMVRWIIMSFIFKSTALNSQWPNQFKYFLKLQQTHAPTTRRFSHSAHLFFGVFFFFFQTCWTHCLTHTQMTSYYCARTRSSLSRLQKQYMSCRPFPSAAQPVCEQPQ